jgi:GT2 family glycosyltransferase
VTALPSDRTAIEEPHHQSLERLAVEALNRGDTASAFRFADRRCRVAPPPGPHSHVLRAEALFRSGQRDAAVADLAAALRISPANLPANLRLLAWGDSAQQRQAARNLVCHDRDFASLRRAIKVLHQHGQKAFAHLVVFEDLIEGWALLSGNGIIEIAVSDGYDHTATILDSDPYHPLADLGRALSFSVARPWSPWPQTMELVVDDQLVYSVRAGRVSRRNVVREQWSTAKPQVPRSAALSASCAGLSRDSVTLPDAKVLMVGQNPVMAKSVERSGTNSDAGAHGPSPRTRELETAPGVVAHRHAITVVVPVYRDYEATRACLQGLIDDLRTSPRYHAIVVDDAGPDALITRYLAWVGAQPQVRVITNKRNLGFVGSVNGALAKICEGDVILLNSDTLVPRGFIARLATASRSSHDIGTLVPLSNNGDLVGFPVPRVASPIGSAADVARIDRIAAEVNAGRVIDIPNGTGFCLYITRSCLDAVGLLSEDFDRGYLEDVDFCLRARQRGYRNVCVPSVYVGHAGSRSFGYEKRGLVSRNIDILCSRHPGYQLEFAAFDRGDPLRSCREAIERQAPASAQRPRLLVTGAGVVGAIARKRGRELAMRAQPCLILEVRGNKVTIFDPGGGVPQSLRFDLAALTDGEALIAYLRKLQAPHIEIFDPVAVPFRLLDLISELKLPFDLVIADAGFLGRRGAAALLAATRSVCASCGVAANNEAFVARWRESANNAEHILAADEHAKAFAASLFPQRRIIAMESSVDRRGPSPWRPTSREPARSLGLLPVRRGAQEQWLIASIARAFKTAQRDLTLTILGVTVDDAALMRIGNTHVTGALDDEEIETLYDWYDLDALFVCTTQPLFGHPHIIAVCSSSRPTAYFDWSNGEVAVRPGDLALDTKLAVDAIVAELDCWLTSPSKRQEVVAPGAGQRP